jgi:hypothetical protein
MSARYIYPIVLRGAVVCKQDSPPHVLDSPLHCISVQVNPHSAILSSMGMAATVWSNPVYNTLVGYLRFLTAQCRDWVKNIVKLFIFRSRAPIWSARRGLTQTLTQVGAYCVVAVLCRVVGTCYFAIISACYRHITLKQKGYIVVVM